MSPSFALTSPTVVEYAFTGQTTTRGYGGFILTEWSSMKLVTWTLVLGRK